MKRFSLWSLARNALSGHAHWTRHWRAAQPKKSYDVVIIGGGGHGLATAYYLAKNHGVRNITVLEKGPLALRNTGRNTTVFPSNYLWEHSAHFYQPRAN